MIVASSLIFGALVTLTNSKLIVTNDCMRDVYVWSVPNTKGYASNKAIKAGGGQYVETFHQGNHGSGIAVKISPEPNGIYIGKPQAQVSYNLDHKGEPKVWVNFENIANEWNAAFAFHTCKGVYNKTVPIHYCGLDDNVELVICGSQRAFAERDGTSKSTLAQCVNPKRNQTGYYRSNPRALRHCHGSIISPRNSTVSALSSEATEPKPDRPSSLPLAEVLAKPVPAIGTLVKPDGHHSSREQLTRILDTAMEDDCHCWITGNREIKCDNGCQQLVKSRDGQYKCLATGDFEFCLQHKMLKRVVNANTFAEKYAEPLLRILWSNACATADQNHWDCAEFKSSIKAAYPEVDSMELHGAESKDADTSAEVKKKKKPAVKSNKTKACRDLIVLFGQEYHERNCEELIKDIKIHYRAPGSEVHLKHFINKYYKDADDTELDDEFSQTWPELDWTTDDEAEV